MSQDPPTACLLVIGNEVLSGRTKDANINYFANQLTGLGIRLAECRVIPDIKDVIIDTLNTCRKAYTYVFTTGGIGGTHDDITGECVAAAFGLDYGLNREAEKILLDYYGDRANAARMRMARTPVGAKLIANPISKAPGFQVENVFVMAGVPKIAQAMFDEIRHTLTGGQVLLSKTVATIGISEGMIAIELGKIQDAHPDVEIGSYPFLKLGAFGTNLVVRGTDETLMEAACAELRALVISAGGTPIDGDVEGDALKS